MLHSCSLRELAVLDRHPEAMFQGLSPSRADNGHSLFVKRCTNESLRDARSEKTKTTNPTKLGTNPCIEGILGTKPDTMFVSMRCPISSRGPMLDERKFLVGRLAMPMGTLRSILVQPWHRFAMPNNQKSR